MLQNARVAAFTVSELFREIQKGGGGLNYAPLCPSLRFVKSDYPKLLSSNSWSVTLLTFSFPVVMQQNFVLKFHTHFLE